MKTIWKYVIDALFTTVLQVPIGAKPLYVGKQISDRQCEMPYIWFLVDSEAKKVDTKIWIVDTGQSIERITQCGSITHEMYVGTVQMRNGLVWHVFAEDTGNSRFDRSYARQSD